MLRTISEPKKDYTGSQNFPEFFDINGLMHHEFIPPGQAGHIECASFAKVARFCSEEAALQVAGSVVAASR
jgi:hypothetical protein